jgi:lipopolysaccharide export system permease protein
MKLIRRYLLASFLPALLGGLFFFIMILELAELIPNLAKFVNLEVRILDVGAMLAFYVPKCVSYSLPIAILFAVSFTLGNMYAKNELVAVFNSGVSLYSFTIPLLLAGALLSIASFFFEDKVVIDSLRLKNQTYQKIMRQNASVNSSEVTLMSRNGQIVYQANYYNGADKSLQGLVIVERDGSGAFLSRINAERAVWEKDKWVFFQVKRYSWKPDRSSLVDQALASFTQDNLDEPPDSFAKSGKGIEEMKAAEAKRYILQLKRAGFPYGGEYAEYYKRFAFSLTPLIVILLSITMGGRFRKNILLMSLLGSLIVSAGYYIFQMVTMLLAKLGYVDPLLGAWLPFGFFISIALVLYRFSRT